jgi:enoyl-CoA hydratase/carnithine racemase
LSQSTATQTDAGPSVETRINNSHVATLTINRPSAFNALSVDVMTALTEQLRAVSARDDVRVIVITGSGKAFSAGHDLSELHDQCTVEDAKAIFSVCTELMLTMVESPKPVVARVQGVAAAAGCQLVATADLAIAATGAKFSVSGINLGLFCATPMVALTRNVPRKFAMELLLTGKFIDADTACHFGLVNSVVPPEQLDEAIADLTTTISEKSPLAIALGKRLFYDQLEASLHVAYENSGGVMAENLISEDAKNGIRAFLDKRPPPEWVGR